MNLLWLIVIVLVILAIFGAPTYPYSSGWGWAPSGGIGLIAVILIILFVLRII